MVRSRQAVKLPAVQPIVMTTGALACLFLGENMGKKNIFILCFFFFTFLLSADEFIYKLQNPRINNKEVEYIQKSLSKINLLPEKEIDGWYGPVTEKAVKELQKIIGIKETGEVNSIFGTTLLTTPRKVTLRSVLSY